MMDFLATFSTWTLALILLALMMGANELGFQIGLRRDRGEPESSRVVSNGLKTSVFGLVALLLGFSFSMTSGKHDQRRKIVLDEANAIGTCYLRAGLLADAERDQIRSVLRRYVDARLERFENGLDANIRQRTSAEMDQLLEKLWNQVELANKSSREAVRTSQIVAAANDVIDLSSTREWAVRNHIPLPVLALLATCVVVSSILIGHSSGQNGRRYMGLWAALNVLLVLVLFVVLDFDRPRRGFIQVDHAPLIELKASFDRSGAK